jgi:hypothetical protein
MATAEVTFTLDEISIQRLQDASERLALSKSEVVREAIPEFHQRLGRLTDREPTRLLRVYDELTSTIPRATHRM